ncbi:MAG: LamG domain-containing protein [Candidatus Micrarchaeota archaeon]|nr:LamG domain-containing protein [Candidatus Micrarchaeota archaeon]MDE1849164.1 LamG domain-containing protein [Candidatus Micrarchaeota archaeon]
MEYLMTYGWAILAIAIVMVSLYSLGIFNVANLKPAANPGSCEVVRTTAQTSLAGQCSNLIPKYVGQFNGASSINAGTGANMNFGWTNPFTITAWIETSQAAGSYYVIVGKASGGQGYLLSVNSGEATVYLVGAWASNRIQIACSSSVNDGKWHYIATTYNGNKSATGTYVYMDNTQCHAVVADALTSNFATNNNVQMGYMAGWGGYQGSTADIQIYNTSLDNTSLKALYQEGIGGAPIDVGHLVAWWPLNGNANDYSGNNNQGTSTNIVWNANWQNNYTQPGS